MDLTGKILPLSYTSSDSKITLDCSNLLEGIYFIKVVSGEKEVVKKFAVQK
jgi:hypothetical protein